MEAHPPYHLPEGVRPLWTPRLRGLRLSMGRTTPLPKGSARWTPALAGVASMVARTIPLAPFLEGRGEVQKCRVWRHILHTACQWGCTPLDSPLAGAALNYGADHPLPKGSARWTPALWTVEVRRMVEDSPRPLPEGRTRCTPALRAKDVRRRVGGHPQTPAKGRRPLDSRFQHEDVLSISLEDSANVV